MNEFERLNVSELWKAAFKLERALLPLFPEERDVLHLVARELPLIAGQAIFSRSGHAQRLFLEELLARARQVEEALHLYDCGQRLFRVWFRLDKLREAAFMEHAKIVDTLVEELLLEECLPSARTA